MLCVQSIRAKQGIQLKSEKITYYNFKCVSFISRNEKPEINPFCRLKRLYPVHCLSLYDKYSNIPVCVHDVSGYNA